MPKAQRCLSSTFTGRVSLYFGMIGTLCVLECCAARRRATVFFFCLFYWLSVSSCVIIGLQTLPLWLNCMRSQLDLWWHCSFNAQMGGFVRVFCAHICLLRSWFLTDPFVQHRFSATQALLSFLSYFCSLSPRGMSVSFHRLFFSFQQKVPLHSWGSTHPW